MNIKQKRIITKITIILLFSFYATFAQNIILTYDQNGNRITKQINGTLPVVNVTGDTTGCVGDILSLTANSTISNTTYNWSIGSFNTTIAILADSSQYISVIGTSPIGCKDTSFTHVVVDVPPLTTFLIGNPVQDSTVCQGSKLSYKVSKHIGSQYNWEVTAANGVFESGQGTDSVRINWYRAGTATLKVTETSAYGCIGQTISKTINVAICTGVNNNQNELFQAYYNSLSGNIEIMFTQQLSQEYKLVVSDVSGQEIVKTAINTNFLAIPVGKSVASAGAYFVSLYNNNQLLFTKK